MNIGQKWINIFDPIYLRFKDYYPFERLPHKMVRHTQTIRRVLPKNCLSVLDHFVGLMFKKL